MKNNFLTLHIPNQNAIVKKLSFFTQKNVVAILVFVLTSLSIFHFIFYYQNGLGLAYNDARSHLDIGRRVVEGLKPGIAQIGSVWLPLPHILMIPTIWNDFMWHSGLSGALQSMISYVGTGIIIYLFLQRLGVRMLGSLIGVGIFATNINILYLQSTAMTELLLIFTMLAGCFYLLVWFQEEKINDLIKSSFWVMLSTLIRYDGWFLLLLSALLIVLFIFKKYGYKKAEGMFILYCTMAGFGVILWFLWNTLIFKDPFYFALGPYSAHAQQTQLSEAGVLATKGNLFLSIKIYFYALVFNSNAYLTLLAGFGAIMLFLDKKISVSTRIASLSLFAPFMFNILALYLGHSVLFVQGISGDTWFNVRYGIMFVPAIAIFIGYLIDKVKPARSTLIFSIVFVLLFSYLSYDAVTIDDGRVGSSQKNVSEVSSWLNKYAKDKKGFILISAASHDAIIFSSGLPMSKFIHEGTGQYWENATVTPDHWARWIVARTNDNNDLTFRLVNKAPGFAYYNRVKSFPFADIYELDDSHLSKLITDPIIKNQK